jgi:D-psicose/D-tagatose/L-ribulose 3-epimerase
MKLAISNIAWDPSEDSAVSTLLHLYGVDSIDVAPGKYFPDLLNADDDAVYNVGKQWTARGIRITGMQALLFGTTGLNVFGPRDVQVRMLKYLESVCRIGSGLGATRLVFGSPKNRDRSGLTDEQARSTAAAIFWVLGDIARSHGVVICLEPNPPCYGSNFMCNTEETADIVRATAHPAIKMQLDTGACTINKEDVADVVHRYAQLIGHVHASEPDLLPLGDGGTDHVLAGAAVRQLLPDHVVTIEMLATKNEPHLQSIERALRVARAEYVPEK